MSERPDATPLILWRAYREAPQADRTPRRLDCGSGRGGSFSERHRAGPVLADKRLNVLTERCCWRESRVYRKTGIAQKIFPIPFGEVFPLANQRSDKSSRNAFVSLVVFNDPHVRLLPFGPLLALLGLRGITDPC